MEARDVLADDVHVRRPPPLELPVVLAKADRGDVVDQRVEPDVGDAARIVRQRDPPGLARAADRDVLEPRLEQPQDLVPADVRHEKLGVR